MKGFDYLLFRLAAAGDTGFEAKAQAKDSCDEEGVKDYGFKHGCVCI